MKTMPVRRLAALSASERRGLRPLMRPNGYGRGWLAAPRPDDLMVTVVSRGKNVGLGLLRVFRTDCLNHGMFGIFTVPSHRRKGVGTRLVKALRAEALKQWPSLTLASWPPEPGAAAFFEKVLR